jgi:hypothetical protein
MGSKKEFKISTSLGTLYVVLAIITWITSILCIRRAEGLISVITFTTLAVILTLTAIKFGILCFDNKDTLQQLCEGCGEQITYYWFFGIYVGRHICSKKS